MKRKFMSFFGVVLAVLMTCTVFLAGCFGGGDDNIDTTPKEYTIQYTDDSGVHTITVTDGMPYSLDVIPEKTGYEFLGMYDAEVGGTQYISASGSSLAPYTDKKNMVLFPRYEAKEYTVILDYQGAPVTGSRQLTVAYGSSLPELPKNLTGEHKEFIGWYTAAECGGTKIADEYGLIPLVSVLNEQNFDLKGAITLYAGFETEKHTVTFCFEAGMDTEEVQVAYGTPISQVVPKTRVEGKAVLNWSKTQGGAVWNDEVTNDTVLYALEYAPVIDLDCNGGNEVTPVVARAGDTIILPTPTKDLAKFSHWEDMQGNVYEETTMPADSISLKAVWQAKLVFDENGGSDVDDISKKAGTSIELPTPEKEGFIFAGWYNVNKEKYTSSTMPAAGVALKAGWYKAKNDKIVLKSAEDSPAYSAGMDSQGETSGPEADWRREVDLSKYLPSNGARIHIKINLKMKTNQQKDNTEGGLYLYDGSIVSDSNLLVKLTDNVSSTTYKSYVFEADLNMRSNTLYCCYFAKKLDSSTEGWTKVYFSDIWIELKYPDTTNLYL